MKSDSSNPQPPPELKATLALESDRTARLREKLRHGPAPGGAAVARAAGGVHWFLESSLDGGKRIRRQPLRPLPFRIGRRPGLELCLPSDMISREHAEIYREGQTLHLRDLLSTNGTFVNRTRISDAPLREGDVLHFGDFEYRLARETLADVPRGPGAGEVEKTVSLKRLELPGSFVPGTRELRELLEARAVSVVFQPIVLLPGGGVDAYEALGRGRHASLPESPGPLFQIAESMGAAVELSQLFRFKAVSLALQQAEVKVLFLNTHPAEFSQPGLVESMTELAALAPQLDLILEIHESCLADTAALNALRGRLAEIGVGLAYDDFGAGQSRLLELAEVPPRFLKFDIRFVAGIDKARTGKRRVLTSLVSLAHELGVQAVAEGVETAAEAEACVALGFSHAQGYYFGRPTPLETLAAG